MKIGDRVRFLSEVGGGRVSGFQGKDIVLVEDEDGFDVPMRITEVVVIGEEDYDTRHVVEVKQRQQAQTAAPRQKRKSWSLPTDPSLSVQSPRSARVATSSVPISPLCR